MLSRANTNCNKLYFLTASKSRKMSTFAVQVAKSKRRFEKIRSVGCAQQRSTQYVSGATRYVAADVIAMKKPLTLIIRSAEIEQCSGKVKTFTKIATKIRSRRSAACRDH